MTDITYTDTGERLVNGTRYHLRLLDGHWTITEVARAEEQTKNNKPASPHTCSGILKREYTPGKRGRYRMALT